MLVPGGVNSPFRGFDEVGGHTIFMERALGSRMWDADGNEFVDYLGAWGPAVLGHCHPRVVAAVQSAVAGGAVLGTPHRAELELATLVCKLLPSMQRVRFVNSGSEAVMSAVRLARGYTKRDLILTFEGSYHGHADSVLASRNHTASAGVPGALADCNIQVPFNDIEALSQALQTHANNIAAVLMEPVCGSMSVVPPLPGYLEKVAALCRRFGVLLIFDEVLTGLRVARGGAQALYGIEPDLTCLGKALGGGMPIGAYGGRAEIMERLLPSGDVYQAGTFSGNPATMAAAVETVKLLDDAAIYARLERQTEKLFDGLRGAAGRRGQSLQLQRVGSMFAIIFAPQPVTNYQEHLAIDARAFATFFHALLERGIYLPPSAVDAACVSAAHSDADIELTVAVCTDVFKLL
jgi:glutamate-1-semialdehyde 2,1-aminomutase